MEVSDHLHTPAALLGGNELLVQLKRPGWTQTWCGCLEEGRHIFTVLGIETKFLCYPAVLDRLSLILVYTDCFFETRFNNIPPFTLHLRSDAIGFPEK